MFSSDRHSDGTQNALVDWLSNYLSIFERIKCSPQVGQFSSSVLGDAIRYCNIALGDVNGDGYLDLVSGNLSWNAPPDNKLYINSFKREGIAVYSWCGF